MTTSPSPRLALRASLAAAAMLGIATIQAHATSGPGCFRIVGVAADDVLNLRAGPDASAALTGTMHPKRHGIIALSGACAPETASKTKQWCKVTHHVDTGTTVGWASRRFLDDVDCP